MTLYWWMHWFWVTAQIVVSMTRPSSEDGSGLMGPSMTNSSLGASSAEPLAKIQQNYRMAKAIGVEQRPEDHGATAAALVRTTDAPRNLQIVTAAAAYIAEAADASDTSDEPMPVIAPDPLSGTSASNKSGSSGYEPPARVAPLPSKKEPKMTWIQTFSKPPKSKLEQEKTSSAEPSTTTTTMAPTTLGDSTTVSPSPAVTLSPEELTVMPLQTQRARLELNAIHREQQSSRGSSVSDELLFGENQLESDGAAVLATPASVLDAGVGDSSRLGRARGAFSKEFQREQLLLEGKLAENKQESSGIKISESGINVAEIATITGSCLAVIVLLSTVGSFGFIMYRRRYLNPPQTLNSDKCSNPDSSGYIDDSTMRDNSEEMYSLDNDSFLNSLEAMTIQNYWTDSVKHTKL